MAALAEAGLTIPEGKTLADFVPAGAGDDSDDEDDREDVPDARGVTPVDDAGGRDATPAPAGAAVMNVVPITPPATPRPGEDAMDVSGPPALPAPNTPPAAAPALVKVTVKSKAPKYRLKYGWKATPSGLLPMGLYFISVCRSCR